MSTKPPNIIFLIADDHRHDAIGYKNSAIQTPHLDRLAEKGVSLENLHIMGGFTAAVCMPTRAVIHSGANTFKAAGTSVAEINPDLTLMGETLQQQGYHTHAVGKWHNGTESFQRSFSSGDRLFFGGMTNGDQNSITLQPFDSTGQYPKETVYESQGNVTETFSDAAVEFIQGKHQEPYFLYVAFTSPHDPRTAPPQYHQQYPPQDMTLPPNFLPKHPFDNGWLTGRDEQLAAIPRSASEVRRHISDYYAMITHLDSQVGRIIEAVNNSPESDNTLIIYTADHGLSVGQHGLMGKQNLYDHSIRVPFIISGPEIRNGLKLNQLVWQVDICPTVCELAKVPVPKSVEGRSMRDWFCGDKTGAIRKSTFTVYCDTQRCVKKDGWKLIRYYHNEKRDVGTNKTQLFYIPDDPWEMDDLSQDRDAAEDKRELEQLLTDWQKQVGDGLM